MKPFLHHFRKPCGQHFLVVDLIEVPDDGEFNAATERLNEITNEAGAIAAEAVDQTDSCIETGGEALPLDGMIEKTIPVVEGCI